MYVTASLQSTFIADRIMVTRLVSIIAGVVLCVVLHPQSVVLGQTPPPFSTAPSPTGPQWAQVLQLFDEWAAVQQIYTPEQVRQWRTQILGKASSLPAPDAAAFAADLSAKLQVMLSAEARDARKWLAETLAVASDSYAKEVKAGLPDPRTMTAGQIQARLDAFENREANVKQVEASLQKTRQMQIKAIEADQQAQAAANAAAWQGSDSVGSSYNPIATQRIYGGRYVPPAGRTIGGFFW
jgi:hypothetical protein